MHKRQQDGFTPSNEELAPYQSLGKSLNEDERKVASNSKDEDLFDKLSGLLLVSGFETALTQIMLQEMYCRDKKSMANYEKLRNMAAMKVKEQFGEIYAGKKIEHQETVRKLNQELERLSSQNQVLAQEKIALQEKYQHIYKQFTASERNFDDIAVALKSYVKLTQWQELRIQEIPKIRKHNSGIFKEQTWESAAEEFEDHHQRPKVPQLEI